MTEWQCNFFLLQELGSFNRSFYILQVSLKKGWVKRAGSSMSKLHIPGNLLLTVIIIIQIQDLQETMKANSESQF